MFAIDDATRARAFYEDVLGLTRGLSSPDGIAFEVRDLDALEARLKAAGVACQGERVHGPRCRMSNIRDTEGNAIILHELTR